MRPLITLTLLLTTLSHDAHAQMEVLAVHGDVRIKNNAVDPMQLVPRRAEVVLGENSFISFVDADGNTFEFHGPQVVQPKLMIHRPIKPSNAGQWRTLYDEQPHMILIHPSYPILLVQPHAPQVHVRDSGCLYLEWLDLREQRSNSYKVFVLNVFNDTVYYETTTLNHFELKPAQVLPPGNLFIFGVSCNNKPRDHSLLHGLVLSNQGPTTCTGLTGSGLLIQAITYELFQEFESAREAFEKARDLDPDIFGPFLDRFIKRQSSGL